MTFHTVYNLAENKNKDKVYDRSDNVDRVSYVDSTRLIERFILEGHNLNEVRAKALNAGMYKDADDALSNDDGLILPVYETDPAILQPIIDSAKADLTSRVSKKRDEIKNDAISADSEVTDRSPDAGKIDA